MSEQLRVALRSRRHTIIRIGRGWGIVTVIFGNHNLSDANFLLSDLLAAANVNASFFVFIVCFPPPATTTISSCIFTTSALRRFVDGIFTDGFTGRCGGMFLLTAVVGVASTATACAATAGTTGSSPRRLDNVTVVFLVFGNGSDGGGGISFINSADTLRLLWLSSIILLVRRIAP